MLTYAPSVFSLNHQEEIKKAQKWVNTFKRDYPILIFNRDEMIFFFTKNNLLGEEKKEARRDFIQNYIREKTGVELEKIDASSIDIYLTDAPDSALALPFETKDKKGNPTYKFCGVFPIPPNGNQQLEIERITGINVPDAYGDYTYKRLSKKMTLKELYLFSLYHEVGHCLDKTFMPEGYKSYGTPAAHTVHLSEAFAETFALLVLAKRLDRDIGQRRAFLRALYSNFIGPYLSMNPGMGDENRSSGGAIYFLSPYIMEAVEQLQFKKINLNENDPESFVEEATKIIEYKQYKGRSFAAINRSLQEGYNKTLGEYQRLSEKDPEFFYRAYVDLISFKAQIDYFIQGAFAVEEKEEREFLAEAPSPPLMELCSSASNKNWAAFEKALFLYREKINTAIYSYQSSAERYKELNHLGQSLEKSCDLKN